MSLIKEQRNIGRMTNFWWLSLISPIRDEIRLNSLIFIYHPANVEIVDKTKTRERKKISISKFSFTVKCKCKSTICYSCFAVIKIPRPAPLSKIRCFHWIYYYYLSLHGVGDAEGVISKYQYSKYHFPFVSSDLNYLFSDIPAWCHIESLAE